MQQATNQPHATWQGLLSPGRISPHGNCHIQHRTVYIRRFDLPMYLPTGSQRSLMPYELNVLWTIGGEGGSSYSCDSFQRICKPSVELRAGICLSDIVDCRCHYLGSNF